MTRVFAALGLLVPLLAGGCARHYVVERDFGRVDSERSVTTNSDEQWSVRSEPPSMEDRAD